MDNALDKLKGRASTIEKEANRVHMVGTISIRGDGVFLNSNGQPLGPYEVVKQHYMMARALHEIEGHISMLYELYGYLKATDGDHSQGR